jgi:adenylate kinase family enzyme
VPPLLSSSCNAQQFQIFAVDDEIVIELVEKEIQGFEKKSQSWIIQGFPRTRVQALALQKMSIIPDKFINLQVKKHSSLARIKQNLVVANQDVYGDQADEVAERMF